MVTLKRDRSNDTGATLLLMILMMVAFLGMAAVTVDLGFAYAVKRQLSSTADAAALAGAQEAGLKYKTLGGCGPDGTNLDSAITSAVNATHSANAPYASTGAPATTIVCTDNDVTVTVRETSNMRTFFGGILGVSTLSPAEEATANVFGSRELGGLRPFTLCMGDALTGAADPSKVMIAHYGRHNGSGDGCQPTGSPGNWGYASFDVGGSQPTLLCLIEHGYGPECGGDPEGFDVGTPEDWDATTTPPSGVGTAADGNTGNSLQPSNSSGLIDDLLGVTILLPAAENWTGNGINATYDGFGALAVKLVGYIYPKPNGTIQKEEYLPGSACLTQSPNCRAMYNNTKANWTDVSLVLFWQYQREWVSSNTGQTPSGGSCKLGDVGCNGVLRLTR